MRGNMTDNKILVEDISIVVDVYNSKNSNPYYKLKYKPIGNDEYKIGFDSYDLNQVCQWLDEYFILSGGLTTVPLVMDTVQAINFE